MNTDILTRRAIEFVRARKKFAGLASCHGVLLRLCTLGQVRRRLISCRASPYTAIVWGENYCGYGFISLLFFGISGSKFLNIFPGQEFFGAIWLVVWVCERAFVHGTARSINVLLAPRFSNVLRPGIDVKPLWRFSFSDV